MYLLARTGVRTTTRGHTARRPAITVVGESATGRSGRGTGTAGAPILQLRGRRQHPCGHERAAASVARFLEDRLRLKVNADKSAVADVEERVRSRFPPNRTKPLRSIGWGLIRQVSCPCPCAFAYARDAASGSLASER